MGSRGGALVGGLGDEVPQKLKNFKSTYKQILRIFLVVIHTIHEIALFDFLFDYNTKERRIIYGHSLASDVLMQTLVGHSTRTKKWHSGRTTASFTLST